MTAHADGTPWSFVLALNSPTEFTGGGTHFIDSKQIIRPQNVGDVAIFCGKNVHEGVSVTSGVRYIMAGFCNYMSSDVTHGAYLSHHDSIYDGSAGLSIQTGDLLRGVYIPKQKQIEIEKQLLDVQGIQSEAQIQAQIQAQDGLESESGVEYLTNGSDVQTILQQGLMGCSNSSASDSSSSACGSSSTNSGSSSGTRNDGNKTVCLSVLVERLNIDTNTGSTDFDFDFDLNEEEENEEDRLLSDDKLIVDMIRNVNHFVTVGEFWNFDGYCS